MMHRLLTLGPDAVSNAYELAVLVAVLERKGLVTQAEVLEEITRLRAKSVKARYTHHERRGNPDAPAGNTSRWRYWHPPFTLAGARSATETQPPSSWR